MRGSELNCRRMASDSFFFFSFIFTMFRPPERQNRSIGFWKRSVPRRLPPSWVQHFRLPAGRDRAAARAPNRVCPSWGMLLPAMPGCGGRSCRRCSRFYIAHARKKPSSFPSSDFAPSHFAVLWSTAALASARQVALRCIRSSVHRESVAARMPLAPWATSHRLVAVMGGTIVARFWRPARNQMGTLRWAELLSSAHGLSAYVGRRPAGNSLSRSAGSALGRAPPKRPALSPHFYGVTMITRCWGVHHFIRSSSSSSSA